MITYYIPRCRSTHAFRSQAASMMATSQSSRLLLLPSTTSIRLADGERYDHTASYAFQLGGTTSWGTAMGDRVPLGCFQMRW